DERSGAERAAAPAAFERPSAATGEAFADPLADEFADAFAAEFGSTGEASGSPAWDDGGEAAGNWPAAARHDAPVYDPPAPVAADSALAEVDMDFGDLDLTDE